VVGGGGVAVTPVATESGGQALCLVRGGEESVEEELFPNVAGTNDDYRHPILGPQPFRPWGRASHGWGGGTKDGCGLCDGSRGVGERDRSRGGRESNIRGRSKVERSFKWGGYIRGAGRGRYKVRARSKWVRVLLGSVKGCWGNRCDWPLRGREGKL
jgi:hypothetical protein